jgi:MFS transporter, PPP family, 3-phenylpropionic acid transporter
MRDVISLYVLVTAVGVALGVFFPFISVILAGRGFSPSEIGLVFALGAIGFTIAVPAWGHLADVRLGRARTLVVCAVGAGVAVAGLLLPLPPILVVALLMTFWVFESSWQPLADALTVNALAGRDYARIRLFTSLGFAAAAIGSGFVYEALGYDAAFVLCAAASLVMAVSAWAMPDVERADLAAHRRRAGAVHPTRMRPGLGSVGVALSVAPRLGAVLAAATLLHIGIISGFTFLPLRIEELGGSPADVALSAGVSAAAEIPAMLVMGAIAQRAGLRAIFVVATLLYAASMVSWMVIEVPLAIVATRAVTGIAFAGALVAIVLTIAAILPADLQGTGQALFQTSAFGIGAVLANSIGGAIYETAGHAVLFGSVAALAVVAGLIGWVAVPRDSPRPAGAAVPQASG